jgi:pyroglutamyl-peptidase
MTASTVLLMGFEPFDRQPLNASWAAVQAVDPARLPARCRLIRGQLPCVFAQVDATLRAALRAHAPDLVVLVGQAGGRAALSVERVAINVDDARIPDNAGAQPIDTPIAPRGPVAFWSTLPIKAAVETLRQAGLPAEVSQTAGTFLCNHAFYSLMRALRRRPGARGGFVHVPLLPEQAEVLGGPSLTLAEQARGLELVITAALTHRQDLRRVGGATH